MWRELQMRHEEMRSTVNAAKAHTEMGDLNVGLSLYQTVLNYCENELNKNDSPLRDSANFLKPYALNGIGLVHDNWADADTALANYKKALEIFRTNKNSQAEADVLDNIGLTYTFLGDSLQALQSFQQALVIREPLKQPKGWGMTLSNLGYAYSLLENYDEALKQLAFALSKTQASRDRRFEAYTLVWMGMVYAELKDARKALDSYERALAIQQEAGFEDRRGQAITLDKMGEALARSRDWPAALERYGKALERWREIKDSQGEALTLYGIAKVEFEQQNLANARDRVEEAIRIVESLRNRVSARQLQMNYFASKQDVYALAIDVRIRLYKSTESEADLEAALSISESARARSLIDLLAQARIGPNKGMSKKDAGDYQRLEREISELSQTHLRLRGVGAKEAAADVGLKLNAHIKEQDEIVTRNRIASKFGRLQDSARSLSAKEIQQLLDSNTLLLQYSLGEKQSHLWAVTPTNIEHYFLADRADIETAVWDLRQSLTALEGRRPNEGEVQHVERLRKAKAQYRGNSQKLGSLVLGQVLSKLGNKRLVIVADGALQYVPFEALILPRSGQEASDRAALQPLLFRNEIVYEPSASTLALLRTSRRSGAFKTVAVFADPVFNNKDARVRSSPLAQSADEPSVVSTETLARSLRDIGDTGDGDITLSKLEYSLKEANAITAVAPRGSWMKAVGFKANRATVMSPTLKQFNIVHFATHGLLNDKHPELSGIVLSLVNEKGRPQDGYLTLHDIYNLDLPVDMVVLSACKTGLGKKVQGEGLVGLTRGFMSAGVSKVVASLWSVDDRNTAELMSRFYKLMLGKEKLPPSAALRRAKIEMIEARPELDEFYWAGFVLQGDWK